MLRRPAFQPGDKVITGNVFSLVAGLGRSGGELPNPGRFAAPLCGKMAESQQQRDGIFPSTTQPREPKGRPPPPARQSDENGRLRIAPGEAPKRTSITLPVRRASKSAAWEGSRAWPPDHHLPNGNLTLFPQLLVALRGCSAAQRGGFCSRWIKANGSRHSTTRLCTSSRRSDLESSLRG